MRLLQLKLENFRQHKDTVIEFRDGMTAVVGANGTGKTTLLEAITFALYGEQRDNLDHIKFFWSEGKRYAATLRFEYGGTTFEVSRTHIDASLLDLSKHPSEVRASGKTEVKRACERLLGLNYEQFVNSFCAEQKSLAFLNFKSSAERQDEIAHMLGFDRLKQAEDLARQRKKDLASQIAGGRAMLEPVQVLEGRRDQCKRELDGFTQRLQESLAARSKMASRLPELAIARERAELFLDLSTQMKVIEGRAEALKRETKRAEEAFLLAQKDAQEKGSLEAAEKEYQSLDLQVKECEKLREADREREKFLDQKKALESDLARLSAKAAEVKVPDLATIDRNHGDAVVAEAEARSAVQVEDQRWHKAESAANGELQKAATKCAQLAKELEKAEAMAARGICPECGQPVTQSMKAAIEARKSELAAAEAERAAAYESHQRLSVAPPSLKAAQAALEQAVGAVKKAFDEKQEAALLKQIAEAALAEKTLKEKALKEVIDGLALIPSNYDRPRHEALTAKVDALKARHQRFLALADADVRLQVATRNQEAAQQELESEKKRYGELREQRAATGITAEDDARSKLAEHERLASDLRVVEAEIRSAEVQQAQSKERLDESVKRLEERAVREAELRNLEKGETLHETVSREMKALREELNKAIRPDLIARASDNLSLLTNGRYPVLDLDKNFKPILKDDGVDKHVISGGEEDVVALALRLALSELIQEMSGHPMSLLILDEVFGSLDAERRQAVLERLISLKGRFKQIFVISHIEEINQIADQCIYLSRDPESRATVVADSMPEQGLLELA